MPERADELYALPLGDFTQARNALASELVKAGDKAGASAVRALRKPSVPAWAVNQLARRHAKELDELFEIGRKLRDAQRSMLKTGDAGPVRDASAQERAKVNKLVAHAKRILADGGYNASATNLERVADTLYATAVDDEGRELVRRGALTNELKRVGFGGDLGGLSLVPSRAPDTSKKAPEYARLQEEVDELRTKATDAHARADAAEENARRLAEDAEAARARAQAARETAVFEQRAASEADRQLEKAERRLARVTPPK